MEDVIATLKKRWFDLALKEKFPHTPVVTKELDNIEQGINRLKEPSPQDVTG